MNFLRMNFLDAAIDLEKIKTIMHWVLLGIVILIGVLLIIALIRSLFRGWKFGTYRLVVFAALFAACLLSLKSVANLLGQLNMTMFGINGEIWGGEINEVHVSLAFTTENPTLFGGLTQFITDLAKAYDSSVDPSAISEYALSIASSLIAFVLLIVEGILIVTLFGFLINLFWHILWKFVFMRRAERKDKKKKHRGRWISFVEEIVIFGACAVLVIAPLSSIANSVVYAWDSVTTNSRQKELKRADNETVEMVDTIVDGYKDSLFAKLFFNWNRDENGQTFDQKLVSYFTASSVAENPVDFVTTISDVSGIASILMQAGITVQDGVDETERIVFLLTSEYVPMLLHKLADTSLITNFLPIAMGVITSLPGLKEYIAVDSGLELDTNFKETFHTLGTVYEKLLSAPAMKRFYNEDGSVKPLGDGIAGIFAEDSYQTIHEILESLDSEGLAFLNVLLRAVLLNQAVAAKKAIAEDPSLADQISILDFLPDLGNNWDANGNGIADEIPESFKKISIGREFGIIHDCFSRLYAIDERLVTSLTQAMNKGASGDEEHASGLKRADDGEAPASDNLPIDMAGFMEAMFDNLTEVGKIFYKSTDDRYCLFDSIFLQNAGAGLIRYVGGVMNDSMQLEGEDAVDTEAVAEYVQADGDAEVRTTRLKEEFEGIFDVISEFTENETGKNFFIHLSSTPGVYSSDEDMMLGIDDDLLDCFINATEKLDESRLMSAILQKLAGTMLSSGGLFGDAMRFGDGSSNLGHDLAAMLRAFKENQNVILYLTSVADKMGGSGSSYVMSGFGRSEFQTQLGNFLTAYLENGYFNPIWDKGTAAELKNGNISNLIETIFGSVLGDKFKKDQVQAVIAGATAEDMQDLAHAIGTFASSDAISTLTGGGFDLGSLDDINFEELFSAIGGSKIMKAIFAPMINDAVLSNADMISGDSVRLELGEDIDWAKEGRVIDAIVGFAAKHGDFANIDFLGSEPSAIANILTALSGSELFVNKDPADTHYPFSNFISEKMVSSFVSAGTAGSFFVNFDVDTGKSSFEEADFSQFKSACQATTKEGWADEIAAICTILEQINSIGSFDALNSGDLTNFSSKSLREMIFACEDSQVFGPFLIYHLHEKLVNLLGSAQPAFSKANLSVIANGTLEDIKREDLRLIDMLEFVLNPTGKDGLGEKTYTLLNGDGSFNAAGFNLFGSGGMSGNTIKSMLTPLATSAVYNGAVDSGLTAFEQEISTMLYSSSIFGSTSAEDVDGFIKEIADGRTNEERFAIWENEVNSLARMVDEFSELGLSFTGGMSFDALLGTSVSDEQRKANAAKIEKLLLDFNESGCLHRALPIQIEEAMEHAGLKDVEIAGHSLDFNLVHFHYSGTGNRYHRVEIRNFVNIFYYYYQLGTPDSVTVEDAADPTKRENVLSLFGCMRYDKIIGDAFNALFPNSAPIAPDVADFGGNPLDPAYVEAMNNYAVNLGKWTVWNELENYEPKYLQMIA